MSNQQWESRGDGKNNVVEWRAKKVGGHIELQARGLGCPYTCIIQVKPGGGITVMCSELLRKLDLFINPDTQMPAVTLEDKA